MVEQSMIDLLSPAVTVYIWNIAQLIENENALNFSTAHPITIQQHDSAAVMCYRETMNIEQILNSCPIMRTKKCRDP